MSLLLASCALENNVNNGRWIQKRKYNKGWHWQPRVHSHLESESYSTEPLKRDQTEVNTSSAELSLHQETSKENLLTEHTSSERIASNQNTLRIQEFQASVYKVVRTPVMDVMEIPLVNRLKQYSKLNKTKPDKKTDSKNFMILAIIFAVLTIGAFVLVNVSESWLLIAIAIFGVVAFFLAALVMGILAIVYRSKKDAGEIEAKEKRKANRTWFSYFMWVMVGMALFLGAVIYFSLGGSSGAFVLLELAGLILVILFTILTIVRAVKDKKAKTAG